MRKYKEWLLDLRSVQREKILSEIIWSFYHTTTELATYSWTIQHQKKEQYLSLHCCSLWFRNEPLNNCHNIKVHCLPCSFILMSENYFLKRNLMISGKYPALLLCSFLCKNFSPKGKKNFMVLKSTDRHVIFLFMENYYSVYGQLYIIDANEAFTSQNRRTAKFRMFILCNKHITKNYGFSHPMHLTLCKYAFGRVVGTGTCNQGKYSSL